MVTESGNWWDKAGLEQSDTKITALADFTPTGGMGWGEGEGSARYWLFSAGLEGTAVARTSGPGSILGFSCPSWLYFRAIWGTVLKVSGDQESRHCMNLL